MKTYHIITIGCQMNKSDSERAAGYLENLGHKRTDDKYQADLVVINTCGVRQSAEDRVYGIIPRIKKQNPAVKIILTGCLSERKDVQRRLKDKVDIWLPITNLSNLIDFINPCHTSPLTPLLIRRGELKGRGKDDYLKIRPKYNSKFSAFVPIGNGCDNFCTYCVVPNARGREVYRPVEDILDEVRDLGNKGYKEITLIAQNVNSYSDIGYRISDIGNVNFAKLLRMINDVEGNFWIRFATSHPNNMSDELIKAIAECDKVCEHIHLPAQAGDDGILRAMNRGYTVEHYKELISRIRLVLNKTKTPAEIAEDFVRSNEMRSMAYQPIINSIAYQNNLSSNSLNKKPLKDVEVGGVEPPEHRLISHAPYPITPTSNSLYHNNQNKLSWRPPVAITTDIIVGFPGETQEQFNRTVKLFKEVKFDMAYISQYSPRPGTAAKKLADNVPKEEKKRREQALMKVLRKTALENNKEYVGKVVEVLVEGRNKKMEWYGKTRTFKNVKITDNRRQITDLVGEFVKVKISNVRDFGLEGELAK